MGVAGRLGRILEVVQLQGGVAFQFLADLGFQGHQRQLENVHRLDELRREPLLLSKTQRQML